MPRWLQFALFISVFLSIYAVFHFYLYTRIVAMLGLTAPRALWTLRIFIIVMIFSFVLSRMLLSWQLNWLSRAAYWAACLWMGFALYIMLCAAVAHLFTGVLMVTGLWNRLETALGFSPGRLLFVAVTAVALALSAAAVREARGDFKITRLDVPVKNAAPELDGFTIVQISDIHLGVLVGEEQCRKIVDAVNAEHPDLLLITGDLVDENADRLLALADPLRRVNARYGMFAVTGNHEYYAGAPQVIKHAATLGIRFLQNEKIVFPNGLILYGLNDPTAARMNLPVASFEQVIGPEAQTAPAVLMWHQPVRYEQIAALGVDLTLSGHTHHGQMWPLSYVSAQFYPHQHGLYTIGASRFYVSGGLGTWGPPMRLASPPEMVVVKLRKM
jgi:hypothetical protein